MTRILIGGDICPMGKMQAAFAAGQAEAIYHDLLPEIRAADLAVANLECPLVSEPKPIEKYATILTSPPAAIRGFADAGWHVLNLANNHSYDHGATGLQETIETVQKAGMTVVGAGANVEAADQPVVKILGGRRVVVYAMAEREFSMADDTTPGANPLDLINFVNAVKRHKQDGIFIALVHGGREFYDLPSPEMVRRCRFMVEMGADAVVCCHTHCPLPWEIHAGRPIIYGLGNLVFEPLGTLAMPPSWNRGYLAKLEIVGSEVRFEPVPYTQSLTGTGATAMRGDERAAFLQEMSARAHDLQDRKKLAAKWRELCRQQRFDYLSLLFAYPAKMDRLKKVLLPRIHSRKAVGQALMMVQCETHREILETIFKDERSTDQASER